MPKVFYLYCMFRKLSTSIFRTFGAFFVVCFTVSMFICGDAGCLSGKSNENCASFLCSLLNKHNTSSQDTSGGNTKDCSCVCHVLTITTPTFSLDYHPIAQNSSFVVISIVSSAHLRLVYRPPATA
jgi:hypothetical protein